MYKVIISLLVALNTNHVFSMSLSELLAKQKQLKIAKAVHSKLFLSLEDDIQIKSYYAKRQEIITQLKQVSTDIKTKKSDKTLSYNQLQKLDATFSALIELYARKKLLDVQKTELTGCALDFKERSDFYKALGFINQQNYLILLAIAKVKNERNKILNQSLK